MWTFIKAKAAIVLIIAVWGSLIALAIVPHVGSVLYDKFKGLKGTRSWHFNLLLAEDLLVNVIFGGYFRTTISSELGNLQLRGSEAGTQVAEFVDWCFKIVFGQEDHCAVSIELEDKHFFKPSKAVIGFCLYFTSLYFYLTLI